jgi:hypothetical protein
LTVGFAVLVVLVGRVVTSTSSAATLFGPTPYLSEADSPFDLSQPSFWLEDFEDGLLNTPGVTHINGAVRGPSGLTDSVDGDTGAIDGNGNDAHSFLVRPGSLGVTFLFDAQALSGLPMYVGIVSTDGHGLDGNPANTVEFFDENGLSIATLDDPIQNQDVNTTDDDRFLGIFHSGGISKIRVSNLGTGNRGLEVDHLQYGAPVPEPSTLVLLSMGTLALLAYAWRRR